MKYGEQSLIVDMLTRECGRVAFIMRIPKTQKGKLKKQLFQPMNILAVDFDYRQRSALQHLRDARLSLPYSTIPSEPVKTCVALFLAEFMTYVSRSEQRNEPLFDYVESAMRWLDNAGGGYANFHIVFMTRLSRFIGFMPNIDNYHRGFIFDLREGRFTGTVPLHHDFLKPDESEFIPRLVKMDFSNMSLFRMNRSQRNRITEVILRYYRIHIPNMPEVNSFDVLKDLFK